MFRTGTTSLGRAFEILGYKTFHGPWWSEGMLYDQFFKKPGRWPRYYELIKSKIKNYEAFEDYPWMYLYEECDKWFPDAKFILTVRDPERLVASQINQCRQNVPFWTFWRMQSRKKIRKRYLSHLDRVVNYFEDKKNLLIMNLEAGDGWNKLCPFLGVDEVDSEFPHLNKSSPVNIKEYIKINCRRLISLMPFKRKGRKKIKWGVQVITLNDTDFLEATIRMFQPFVDKIVVSVAEKSLFGNIKSDGSAEKIIKALTKEFDNIHLVKGTWKTESDHRNYTMSCLKECHYVFVLDSDEMWNSADINKTKKYVESMPGYNIFKCGLNTRFKKLDWRVDPREPLKPIVVVKKGTKFSERREIKSAHKTMIQFIPEGIVLIEHFSYLRSSDDKIKEKLITFSHAREIIDGWYENVYLQAGLDSKNLHPTEPKCYAGLVKDEINPEIMQFLKKYSQKLFKDK